MAAMRIRSCLLLAFVGLALLGTAHGGVMTLDESQTQGPLREVLYFSTKGPHWDKQVEGISWNFSKTACRIPVAGLVWGCVRKRHSDQPIANCYFSLGLHSFSIYQSKQLLTTEMGPSSGALNWE